MARSSVARTSGKQPEGYGHASVLIYSILGGLHGHGRHEWVPLVARRSYDLVLSISRLGGYSRWLPGQLLATFLPCAAFVCLLKYAQLQICSSPDQTAFYLER